MRVVVPGKWILVGEHAVVRGAPAIVAPLTSRSLILEETDSEIEATPLQAALGKIAKVLDEVPENFYRLKITSDIPIRAGLGSSAALSVAVAKYLRERASLSEDEMIDRALEFENIFHGTSSGLDLAAVFACGPIFFRRGELPEQVIRAWTPKIYLHDSGSRSSTKECVEHVTNQGRQDLDQLMAMATDAARAALRLGEADGMDMLRDSILTAGKCFQEWGLMNEESTRLERELYQRGAIAVKPTGSGNGGFLLSLWDRDPPEEFSELPAFTDF
jgi:mevalonate kinase